MGQSILGRSSYYGGLGSNGDTTRYYDCLFRIFGAANRIGLDVRPANFTTSNYRCEGVVLIA